MRYGVSTIAGQDTVIWHQIHWQLEILQIVDCNNTGVCSSVHFYLKPEFIVEPNNSV